MGDWRNSNQRWGTEPRTTCPSVQSLRKRAHSCRAHGFRPDSLTTQALPSPKFPRLAKHDNIVSGWQGKLTSRGANDRRLLTYRGELGHTGSHGVGTGFLIGRYPVRQLFEPSPRYTTPGCGRFLRILAPASLASPRAQNLGGLAGQKLPREGPPVIRVSMSCNHVESDRDGVSYKGPACVLLLGINCAIYYMRTPVSRVQVCRGQFLTR